MRPGTQELNDVGCGAISQADPDHLRGMSEEEAALVEVGILGDDREVMGGRVGPHIVILGGGQSEVPNVSRAREEVSQCLHKARR